MLERIRLDSPKLLETIIAPLKDPRNYMSVSLRSLTRVTGMSYQELDDFLSSKGIGQNGLKTTYAAIVELKEWYLRKVQRYVRNGLAHKYQPGSPDAILFMQFCEEYRRFGHWEVRSWDDIDEFRLLQDFEAECLDDYPIFSIISREPASLLDRIHRSFLFRLRLKKTSNHNECRVRTILSIILCNRYHIFTAEADSNVDTTDFKAMWPDIFMYYPPRSASRHVFASLAKAN